MYKMKFFREKHTHQDLSTFFIGCYVSYKKDGFHHNVVLNEINFIKPLYFTSTTLVSKFDCKNSKNELFKKSSQSSPIFTLTKIPMISN